MGNATACHIFSSFAKPSAANRNFKPRFIYCKIPSMESVAQCVAWENKIKGVALKGPDSGSRSLALRYWPKWPPTQYGNMQL